MGKSKLPSIINHCKNYAKNILKGLDNTNIDTRIFPVKSELPKDVVSLLDNMSILEPDFYFIRSIKDAELERHFYNVLQQLGISVLVESNRNER